MSEEPMAASRSRRANVDRIVGAPLELGDAEPKLGDLEKPVGREGLFVGEDTSGFSCQLAQQAPSEITGYRCNFVAVEGSTLTQIKPALRLLVARDAGPPRWPA